MKKGSLALRIETDRQWNRIFSSISVLVGASSRHFLCDPFGSVTSEG